MAWVRPQFLAEKLNLTLTPDLKRNVGKSKVTYRLSGLIGDSIHTLLLGLYSILGSAGRKAFLRMFSCCDSLQLSVLRSSASFTSSWLDYCLGSKNMVLLKVKHVTGCLRTTEYDEAISSVVLGVILAGGENVRADSAELSEVFDKFTLIDGHGYSSHEDLCAGDVQRRGTLTGRFNSSGYKELISGLLCFA